MTYIVTHEEDEVAALDLGDGDKPFDLSGAIAFATRLIDSGKAEVTIDDGNGNRVGGAELAAVCAGQKTLTADLRVV